MKYLVNIHFRNMCVGIIFLYGFTQSFGQDLSNLSSLDKVRINGGLNVYADFYNVKGIDPRRTPYSWAIAGNPTLRIGEWSFPFSFSFRDQQFGYGTPFHKFGVSPYYKWIRLHLGYRTMRFSPFIFSGKTFLGAGAELTPGKLRFSGFSGTIRNPLAQRDTIVYGTVLVPTYKRKAYGFSLGYGTTRNYADFIYFKAKDDVSLIPDEEGVIPDIELDPVENLVLGTSWKITMLKRFSISSNLAASAFADNTSYQTLNLSNGLYRFFDQFLDANISTQVSVAGDLKLTLQMKQFHVGLQYRRVEPNFRSLGIPYIQSDVESTTASASTYLFRRKLNISGQMGFEKTNLRQYDYLSRHRVIGSVRTQFVPSSAWVVSAQYSNYQYETRDGLIELNDTLRFVSLTENSGVFVQYNSPKDHLQFGWNANVQMQSIRDQSEIQTLLADVQSFDAGLSVYLQWESTGLRISPSILFARFTYLDQVQSRYGLGMQIRKPFFNEKLALAVYSRYTYNDVENLRNGFVWSSRLNLAYEISKSHSLQWSQQYMRKSSILSPSYSEYRTRLSYGLRF